MRFGAQVRQAGGFLAALGRGEAMGAEVVQLFAQSSRQWRPPAVVGAEREAYRVAQASSGVVGATVCHAPYLVNLVSPDPVTAERSFESLVANLRAATELGAFGLVLHPGSHRGVDPHLAAVRIGQLCAAALGAAAGPRQACDLLLENTAGAGGTVGRTFAELAAIVEAGGGDPRLGICLDTQHLFAAGVSFATAAAADRVVAGLDREVGLGRLRCLHLNDSKVPLGANRDRHENLGAGEIGARALRALLGHPRLQGLPVVLEVPGVEGHGPGAADLAVARRLHAAGVRRRRAGAAAARSGSFPADQVDPG